MLASPSSTSDPLVLLGSSRDDTNRRTVVGETLMHRISAWHDFRVEADEYRELDDERVLVLVRRSGRGKTSGVEVGQLGTTTTNLFHVRGGKVSRMVIYLDRDRAFADLGLAPEGGSPDS
jgi:ketosteroid isomerase-like protein